MMMKSVFWWRKPEYPEETTDLRQSGIYHIRQGQLCLRLLFSSLKQIINHHVVINHKLNSQTNCQTTEYQTSEIHTAGTLHGLTRSARLPVVRDSRFSEHRNSQNISPKNYSVSREISKL